MDATAAPEGRPEGGEARPNERPLGLSSGFVYLVSLITQIVGFGASFALARRIGVDTLGLDLLGFVQFNLLLASVVGGLGDLRLGSAFTFYVARGGQARQYTGTYFVARLALVLLAGIALLALAPVLGLTSVPALNASSAALFGSLAVFVVLPIVWTPGTVYNQLYVAQGNSIRAQYPTLIESFVRTGALVGSAVLFPTVNGVVNVDALGALTVSYALGAAASAAYSMPSVWRYMGAASRRSFEELLTYAWPLLGSLGLQFLVTTALPIFARVYYGVGSVAVFNAANGFRILLLALPAAIAVPLFPHLAGLHVRQQLDLLRERLWRALRYTGILVVPGAVLFVVYRVNLLYLLFQAAYVHGAGGGGGAQPLAILALSAIPLALSSIIGTALNSIGQQRLEFYITSLQVVVLFVSAFSFVAAGSFLAFSGLSLLAIAALLSSVAALALNAYFLRRTIAIRVQWRPFGTILLAAAVEFYVLHEYNLYLPVNRWYELAPVALLAPLVYGAMLVAVGELSREDMALMASSLGLGDRVGRALGRLCWRVETKPLRRSGE